MSVLQKITTVRQNTQLDDSRHSHMHTACKHSIN